MNQPEIEPYIKLSGSAFVGNTTQAYRPISKISTAEHLNVVTLREWCDRNFISKDAGYRLIKLKYLTAFRRHHVWWVTANPDCMEQLLEYLGVEFLAFDVEQ